MRAEGDQTRLVLKAGRGQMVKLVLLLTGWFALGGLLMLILALDDHLDVGGIPMGVFWGLDIAWLLLA